ncbi:MAG TPA: hypothetical protein VN240_00160 [Propylenella sp.]|nr:hypothetical protein [Propylenella sp.]
MPWIFKRQRVNPALVEADAWLARHGFYAYRMAGDRAIDAYCLGDFAEQERWHEIRAIILDRIAPDAGIEDIQLLLGPGHNGFAESELVDVAVNPGSDRDSSY